MRPEPTTTSRIEVDVETFESIQALQDQILKYEIEPEEARSEMERLLAPHVTVMPTEWTATEIVLSPKIRSYS